MIHNRSIPSDTVLPHIVYDDVADAARWLAATFGFAEHYRYGEPVAGAQMRLGSAWFMLRSARPGSATPANAGHATQSLTVFIEDVDAHYRRAKSAGARILEEPHETAYGEWQYAAADLAGHHWLFSRHERDVDPREWGATVVEPGPR